MSETTLQLTGCNVVLLITHLLKCNSWQRSFHLPLHDSRSVYDAQYIRRRLGDSRKELILPFVPVANGLLTWRVVTSASLPLA